MLALKGLILMDGKSFREQKHHKKLETNTRDSLGNTQSRFLSLFHIALTYLCTFKLNFCSEKNERRLQQRTNPRGNVTVHINATDIFTAYDDDYKDYRFLLKYLWAVVLWHQFTIFPLLFLLFFLVTVHFFRILKYPVCPCRSLSKLH